MRAARASFLSAAALLAARDLRLALRRAGDSLLPLGFFLVITTLFPLSLDPSLSLLRDIAPAALWVGALLSSLLALDLLFRDDGDRVHRDGAHRAAQVDVALVPLRITAGFAEHLDPFNWPQLSGNYEP